MSDRINFRLIPMNARDKPCFFCKTRLSVKYIVEMEDGNKVNVCNRCVLTRAKD